jgi:Fe-S-cluster containining protein
VTEREIIAIATHVGIPEDDFIQHYTRLRPNRDGLALLDKPNGECLYLENGACAIQPVKPGQCRAFPNEWNFPGWRDVCGAIPGPRPKAIMDEALVPSAGVGVSPSPRGHA